ncbi:hypothetical protein MMC25_007844 [Agyrium rufum]|nr:hypothetical protein [Agyrium rufum]
MDLFITDASIPDLIGKVALVTGGASGIGLAAAEILAAHNARTYIVDIVEPEKPLPERTTFIHCDVTSWCDVRSAFSQAGDVDIAIANAGISEEENYLEDELDEHGDLKEPEYRVIEVNYRAVLNFVKLAVRAMKQKADPGGQIVITSSATAYAPEQSLPVYSASKLALIGLIRALRSTLPLSNISINGVAPAATTTKLLPQHLAQPMMQAGLPVSSAYMVGLAVVYSAVAEQGCRVEDYGKDQAGQGAGKWNGRVIFTLGDRYTELEEGVTLSKRLWFGSENQALTRAQQSATDFRATQIRYQEP